MLAALEVSVSPCRVWLVIVPVLLCEGWARNDAHERKFGLSTSGRTVYPGEVGAPALTGHCVVILRSGQSAQMRKMRDFLP